MARPIKHNADYFSHDVGMRDDVKIKAIRRKYKHTGYSVWIMLLELLTSNEYFEYEWTELNIELLGPDFDCDADEIKEIVNYCISLNLLQITNGYLHCDTLTKRLEETLLLRRKDYCSNNSKRFKLKGVNDNNNGVNDNNNGVNDNNNTQSKGKESEVNESKLNDSEVKDTKPNNTYGLYYKLYKKLNDYETDDKEYEAIYNDIQDDIGWDIFFSVLKLSKQEITKLDEVITIKLNNK